MDSNYQAWFATQKKDASLGEISTGTFSVIESLLHGEITAAHAVGQLVVARTTADEDKTRGQIFSLVVRIAQFFPEAHSQLIGLFGELFSEPGFDLKPYGWELRAVHDGKPSPLLLAPYFFSAKKTSNATNHRQLRTTSSGYRDLEEHSINQTTR